MGGFHLARLTSDDSRRPEPCHQGVRVRIVGKKHSANGVAQVPFGQRVLLLPHCLRPSQNCPGKMTPMGMDCAGCTYVECTLYHLRVAAEKAGYKGVCIAPGGKLAVRFLAANQPAGVVAIACHTELEEGLEAIDQMEWENGRPAVAVVPLLEDGCVDTKVDLAQAVNVILSRNGNQNP